MFKKIIYSAMALSVTLLPMSEVMAAEIGGTTITTGTYTVDGSTANYTWTTGAVVNNGGTLQIVGYTPTTTAAPNYTQTAGVLNVAGSTTAISAFTVKGASDSAAAISGGSVAVGGGEGTQGASLTIGDYASIAPVVAIGIGQGNTLIINGTGASVGMDSPDTDRWEGDVELNNGALTLTGATKITSGNADTKSSYTQTGGTLNLTNGSYLNLNGLSTSTYSNYMEVTGGTVNVGSSSTDTGNTLTVGPESKVTKDVNVNLYEGNTINLTGNIGANPSLTLDSNDNWKGTIYTRDDGILLLDGYSNSVTDTSSVYKQDAGSGGITLGTVDESGAPVSKSNLYINNENSYIDGGTATINNGSTLAITTATTATDTVGTETVTKEATLGENTYLNLAQGGTLALIGTGSAVINDNVDSYDDDWNGEVILGLGEDSPTLTLRNVTKDFTAEGETAVLLQNSGTLNINGNERGGSNITTTNLYSYEDESGETVYAPNLNGEVNIKGYNGENVSTLVMHYISDDDDTTAPNQQINLQGDSILTLNTNENTVTRVEKIPTGTGANNHLVKVGEGTLNIGDGTKDVELRYNVNALEGITNVNAPNVKIGINDEAGVDPYGSLNIGYPGTEESGYVDAMAGVYATNAKNTTIVDSLAMNYGGLILSNPKGKMSVGGNFNIGSGIGSYNQIHMKNGGMNTINVAGTTTINDTLDLQIDVDPQNYGTIWQANDKINSTRVVQTKTGRLNLSDYKLLSQPTRDHYTFNVVNSRGGYVTQGGEHKTVSGNAARLIPTYIGDYTMIPSSVKGAFDMVLVNHNPEIFRGQVAVDVLYANQQVINNQLFDRMVYSILPYFNGKCTNKVAAADTLYSPYQYSMTDPGLWFKPYANFETIHMTHGLGKVRNNAYGAMIGADFKKAQWGNWTFIPSAYIGYNGGRTTYSGVGMWHNGGQAGLMGTLTNGDFVTMANIYGGGYHNSMDVFGFKDNNALWNAGVGSKTLYNIHLPADFILQPTLYMSYNYVGGSSFTGHFDGFRHKIDALNAFSVAPGLNLIWQKETFSIYALFQAMFNIGSTVSGRVAEVDLPHVGIRDPYFEYGLGASKYFKDRFSGYGQVTARSGSRKGVGFQLGFNVRI